MANDYGLLPTGFVPLALTEVKAQIEADLVSSFGTTLDLSSTSILGQLSGIMANAYADLWSASADLYASQFPAGASGVAVDNLLAINGLSRLPAAATVTDPAVVTATDGTVKHGFVLLGTPGTVVPAGSLFTNGAAEPATFALNSAVTIGTASNAQQVVYFTNQPDSGDYQLRLIAPSGAAVTTPPISYAAQIRATVLTWSSAPTSGFFTLTLGNATTGHLVFSADALSVQEAIAQLPGYSEVTVTGSMAAGMTITWPAGVNAPRVTSAGTAGPTDIADAVAAVINSLALADGTLPFTDVQVGGNAQALTLNFGAFAPQQNQPSTAAVAIPLLSVPTTTLFQGSQSTGVSPQTVVGGNPAQGIGQATCTSTGPVTVLAGQLTTIATPVAGLSAVNNELDCLTGRDVETDVEALTRLKAAQGNASSGSLASIIQKVRGVAGVTQVVGAQNDSNAAQQVLVFDSAPSTGQFNILLAGQATAPLAYNASATDVQQAIRSLTGFEATTVLPSGTLGYAINFNKSSGGQSVPLAQIPTNTTGQTLSAYFGRTAHSIEVTVQGGTDSDIAAAILSALPAGISTYSSPIARTTATISKNSSVINVADATGIEVGQSVEAAGLPLGAKVASITDTSVSLTASANGSGSNVPVVFDTQNLLTDSAGNPISVAFSRPQTVVVWVTLQLTTDMRTTPGDASSDINPTSKFSLGSVAGIKQTLIDTVNATPIGGTVLINGTQGLLNSFRSVPGVIDAAIFVGRSASPTQSVNLALSANEAPIAESYSVLVSAQ